MTEIHLSDTHKTFIEKQLKSGAYDTADEVIAAGISLLQRDEANIRQLLQEGLDDIEAGRVHSYETAEDFLADIQRISNERGEQLCARHL